MKESSTQVPTEKEAPAASALEWSENAPVPSSQRVIDVRGVFVDRSMVVTESRVVLSKCRLYRVLLKLCVGQVESALRRIEDLDEFVRKRSRSITVHGIGRAARGRVNLVDDKISAAR